MNYSDSQNYPFQSPSTVKTRKLDPRSLFGAMTGHFPVPLYSSFFIL